MPKFLTDVQLSGDPNATLKAATKQYIENQLAAIGAPKGILAYDILTTNSSPSSTATGTSQDSGLSVTVSVSSSRIYRVVFIGAMQGTIAFAAPSGMQGRPAIKDASNNQLTGFERLVLVSNSLAYGFELSYIDNAPTSGTKTYKGTFDKPAPSGSSTCKIVASSSAPALLYVEDLGAAL
jgi:hypothetical protein